MPSTRTILYPDSLFCPALLKAIREATSIVEIATFLFRTGYEGETRADEVKEALIAARARGVRVLVALNYSRFESGVSEENFATAQALAAAGCEVRLGPVNRTLHTKLAIIDLNHVFVGSHNLTRGALSFNFEITVYSRTHDIRLRAADYFNDVWLLSTPFERAVPPAALAPVQLTLQSVTPDGAALRLEFAVNHTTGVDAFAAVAAVQGDLQGAVMGESVAPTERVATVVPTVEAGETVYVAVRAYSGGQTIATSAQIFCVTYAPTEPGGGGEGGGGGGEPPPPEPLIAPHLDSVVAGLGGTEITAAWTFAGCANFHRFEIQKRDVQLNWNAVGTVMDPAVRQWVGPGPGTGDSTTYRIVVFNMAEESAASNEITIVGEPPPPPPMEAPVLVSVTQIGPMGINVEYSHVTPAEFARYEVQQRSNETWNTIATITTPETRSWAGGPVAYMDADHPVRVVVFVQSGDSAGSNEMTITPM